MKRTKSAKLLSGVERNTSPVIKRKSGIKNSKKQTQVKDIKEKPVIEDKQIISHDDAYCLILWNDDVNDMIDIVVALFEVCGLSNSACMNTMLLAHESGSAIIKTGSLSTLKILNERMTLRNITTTIELIPGSGGKN